MEFSLVELEAQLFNLSRPLSRLLVTLAQPRPNRPRIRNAATRQRQVRLTSAQVDKLAEAYRAGATVKSLASQFGIPRDTVSQHLTRREVPRRSRGIDPRDVSEVIRLYADLGLSSAAIGERFGCHADTVRAVLRKHDVRVRPRRGWPPCDEQ